MMIETQKQDKLSLPCIDCDTDLVTDQLQAKVMFPFSWFLTSLVILLHFKYLRDPSCQLSTTTF